MELMLFECCLKEAATRKKRIESHLILHFVNSYFPNYLYNTSNVPHDPFSPRFNDIRGADRLLKMSEFVFSTQLYLQLTCFTRGEKGGK